MDTHDDNVINEQGKQLLLDERAKAKYDCNCVGKCGTHDADLIKGTWITGIDDAMICQKIAEA